MDKKPRFDRIVTLTLVANLRSLGNHHCIQNHQ